jgi:hypothetical protein
MRRRFSFGLSLSTYDELEDRDALPGVRAEATAIEKLALQRRERTIAESRVVGIIDRCHRRPTTRLAAAKPDGDRAVSCPFGDSLPVVHRVSWATLPHRKLRSQSREPYR